MLKTTALKTLLLVLLINGSVIAQNELKNLSGKWILERIVVQDKTLKPYKAKYYLLIRNGRLEYNKDVNTVFTENLKIDKETITYTIKMSTLLCCDGQIDSLFAYLKYTGKYFIHGNILQIENENGQFFLSKE